MTKDIWIIRHGQTEFNRLGIVQGSGVDSSLNEKGKWQAQQFFQKYQAIPFDKIYVSALKRTYETVESFIEQKHIPFEKLTGLNEISWGNHDGKAVTHTSSNEYKTILEAWRNGETERKLENGESPAEVAEKQLKALQYILGKSNEKSLLICMHGRAIRILLCLLFHYPLRYMDFFPHENVSLYHVQYNNGLFTLIKFNETSHLYPI